MTKKLLFLLFAIACSFTANADSKNGIIYVKQGATGTGTSWSDALGDIQAAVTEANKVTSTPKDVWVAAGEYPITTTIVLANSVNIYGSFIGTESNIDERAKAATGKAWDYSNATILKGAFATDPTKAQRIFEAKANFANETIIDGFTLTEASGAGNASFPFSAGAILMRLNTTLQNSILKNNDGTSVSTTQGNGGAVNMTGGTIKSCYFIGNTANAGGAIYSNTQVGSTTSISDCLFENNKASTAGGGGAIRSQGGGITNISNVIIQNNQATNFNGGAIYSNNANVRITNSVITNNAGSNVIYLNGGSLINCTVANNIGGIYCAAAGVNLINNVVWGCIDNITDAKATAISAPEKDSKGNIILNRVFKNNASYISIPDYLTKENNILLPSNNSNGEVADAATEIKSGPKFVKVTSFKGTATDDAQREEIKTANWAIGKNSPLIDKGITDGATANDILGKIRPLDKFDIGAYEFIAENTTTGIANTIESNITIYASGNNVYVNNTNGATVYVYNLVGQLVKSTSEQNFAMNQAGTYIVKCGNKVSKVTIAE